MEIYYIGSPQAKFAYNNSINHTTKKTPFEVAYAHKPRDVLCLALLLNEARVREYGVAYAYHIHHIDDEVRPAIEASNEHYKEAAKQYRHFKEFAEGDWVW